MENKQEVVVPDGTPVEIFRLAMAGNIDLEKAEKFLELQEKYEARQARKDYNAAMAQFQTIPLKILKDRKVSYTTSKGKVAYSHASLAGAVEAITVELSKWGLSKSWRLQQGDNRITVTCQIAHALGHKEETSLYANADDSGSKNAIQAIGSTVSYLERYTLLAILGLATHDQDDDGLGADKPEETIDENKLKIIKNLLIELKANEADFLKYLGIEKLEDMPKASFIKAKISLEARKKNANV